MPSGLGHSMEEVGDGRSAGDVSRVQPTILYFALTDWGPLGGYVF